LVGLLRKKHYAIILGGEKKIHLFLLVGTRLGELDTKKPVVFSSEGGRSKIFVGGKRGRNPRGTAHI